MINRITLLVFVFTGVHFNAFGQDSINNQLAIGFYNLENLFDTIDTDGIEDTEFTPNGVKKWNSTKYYKKLDNLSEVIYQMGKETRVGGLAILGVAEVENKSVLEDLVNQKRLKSSNFKIIHKDSPDARGIDVACLYDPSQFTFVSKTTYRLTLLDDSAFRTRDQLLIKGKLLDEELFVIVAHWPSRRGGEKSIPKRIAAGKLGRQIIDSLLSENPHSKIIYMGDLNDDPTDESVKKQLKTSGDIETSIFPLLYNPMEALHKTGKGTLSWNNKWNLFDQILLLPSFLNASSHSFVYSGVKIVSENPVAVKKGKYSGTPYRTYSGKTYLGGYSDHFGVCIFITKQTN